MKLSFGKFKGIHVDDVSLDYLWFLTCWDLEGSRRISCWTAYSFHDNITFQKKLDSIIRCEDASRYDQTRCFIARNYYPVVKYARKLWLARKLCAHCFKALVAIGRERLNGANHADWGDRYLHKKCWREVI